MPRIARITNQAVEKNVQFQRALEVQRRELADFANENNKLLSAASAQMKIDIRRRQAQQQACKSEQQYDYDIREQGYQQQIREKTVKLNQDLASELDRETAEQERKRREIQRICDESPELRELEKALKIAYLNKERAAQFEEKLLLASREQERIQAIEEQMEYDRLNAIRAENSKQGKKDAMYEDQRKVLQQQIREKQAELAEARNQTEIDRKTVDDIVRRIRDEDEADFRRRKESQAVTARAVREYEEQRIREVAIAKANAKAEEDKIMAYNKSVEARSEGVAAKKQAKKDEEDRILAKIVEETERKRKEDEEFSNLRDMLWEEELEAARAKDAQARRDKQSQMKREMMAVNESMLKIKGEMKIKDAENEARMLEIMRKKFADDEAKERREEQNKLAAKKHHIDLIEKQKMQRQSMYDAERSQELAQFQEAERREEYRKKVIQEARKRLLQEHASRLQGFIPGKLFQNSEELKSIKAFSSQNL